MRTTIRDNKEYPLLGNGCVVCAVVRPEAILLEAKITDSSYFSHSRRPPLSHLTLNGRNIPFVNSAKYLGVIFDKKVTWRLHIEMIEAKAFRTCSSLYSLFKSERLSANIKLTLHKALIRSVMTYASSAWEFAADTHLIKLQRLQNMVLRTIEAMCKFRNLHIASKFRTYTIIHV
jgi:hypothetical protein